MVAQQQTTADGTVYHFDSNGHNRDLDVVTDGKTHPIKDGDTIKNGTYTASCDDVHLIANVVGDLQNAGQTIGKVTATYNISKDASLQLISNLSGKVQSGTANFPLTINLSCARK